MKRKDIDSTYDVVLDLLSNMPKTRNSDMILFAEVCRRFNPTALDAPLWHVLENYNEYNIPSFETVRRSRQKAQERFPAFKPNPKVKIHRDANEVIYREFANA